MTNWKKTFGIHICCSVLVLAFLVAAPIVATFTAGQTEAEAIAGASLQKDPLDRLPSSPEEAQERLAEKELAWPDDGAAADVAAAAVMEGVQSGVRVTLPYDSVEGFVSHGGANVKIELWHGAVKQGEKTVKALGTGWFKADMSTVGDIVSGDVIRVTDLGGGPAVDIDCTLTANISFNNDRVTGATVGGNTVDAFIIAPSTYYADLPPGASNLQVTTGAGGGYNADFGGTLDLRVGDAAFVFSTDANGHMVMNAAAGSGAGLVVYPQYDDVMGFYIPGTALQVKADTVTEDVSAMKDGFFQAWFQSYDITDGTNVSCNMGGARNITVRDVSASCNPNTNMVMGAGPANRDMRVTMDPYGTPAIYEVTSDASGTFSVDLATGAYNATGIDVYNVAWYDDEGDCVVYEFFTFSWYLAEGCTLPSANTAFDTYVLVQNPNDVPAQVTLTFMTENGEMAGPSETLPPNSRHTWLLNSYVQSFGVSTSVTSTTGAWIIAERAIYFDYYGEMGGHDSIGTIAPCYDWYLAEGCTLPSANTAFDTWVLVQNPNDVPAQVTLTFMTENGEVAGPSETLPPNSRKSWLLNGYVQSFDVSTRVTADVPVVAERAMYFDYLGMQGGHDSIGTNAPGTTWYLAEGCTLPSANTAFDTYVLVQNPNDVPAQVTLTFMTENGEVAGPSETLPPNSRRTWLLNSYVQTFDVSTRVTADVPVVAERAMYFDYLGMQGGHDSIGVPEIFE